MIRLLLFYIFTLFYLTAESQITATLEPNPASISVSDVSDDAPTIAKATLTNTSETDTLIVRWERNIISMSEGWENSVCDINRCYGTETEVSPDNRPVVIAPGETSNLDAYIFANGIVGAAEIDVIVTDISNDENVLTAKYIIDTTTPTAEILIGEDIQIFPNPAVDAFQIKNDKLIRQVKIYDIIGKEVGRYNHIRGAQYNVTNYQKGIYIIRLFDESNMMVKVLRLNKK